MISAYVQLLAERYRGKLDADADGFLNFVTSGAQWMTRLIFDLLEYSKVGTERTHLVSVDSQRLLDCASGNLRISIAEAGAITECRRLPRVVANNQLTQVFQKSDWERDKVSWHKRRQKFKSQLSSKTTDTGASL